MPASIDRRLLFGFMPTWSTDVTNPQPSPDAYNANMVAKMAAAHAQIVRQGLNWDVIEPNPPQGGEHTYLWAPFDIAINLLAASGMQVVSTIVGTPNWANPGNPAPPASKLPDDAHQADFAAFCQALAAHYSGKVRYFEFWNEPNLNLPSYDEYTKWLGRAYQPLKAGNPDALLSIGGIDMSSTALGDNNPDPNRWQTNYLSGMYAYIASQGQSQDSFFDAVALHPYEKQPQFVGIPPINIDGVEAHYDAMVAEQDGDKTIWITEYGWNMGIWTEQQQSGWLGATLDLLTSANRRYLAMATLHLGQTGRQGHRLPPLWASGNLLAITIANILLVKDSRQIIEQIIDGPAWAC